MRQCHERYSQGSISQLDQTNDAYYLCSSILLRPVKVRQSIKPPKPIRPVTFTPPTSPLLLFSSLPPPVPAPRGSSEGEADCDVGAEFSAEAIPDPVVDNVVEAGFEADAEAEKPSVLAKPLA